MHRSSPSLFHVEPHPWGLYFRHPIKHQRLTHPEIPIQALFGNLIISFAGGGWTMWHEHSGETSQASLHWMFFFHTLRCAHWSSMGGSLWNQQQLVQRYRDACAAPMALLALRCDFIKLPGVFSTRPPKTNCVLPRLFSDAKNACAALPCNYRLFSDAKNACAAFAHHQHGGEDTIAFHAWSHMWLPDLAHGWNRAWRASCLTASTCRPHTLDKIENGGVWNLAGSQLFFENSWSVKACPEPPSNKIFVRRILLRQFLVVRGVDTIELDAWAIPITSTPNWKTHDKMMWASKCCNVDDVSALELVKIFHLHNLTL